MNAAEPTLPQLLARIDQLERRVQTLEASTYKRSVLADALRALIAKWPGPFTAQLLRQALKQYYPDVLPAEDHYQVEQNLRRLERRGAILRVNQGEGALPNLYEKAAPAAAAARKNGGRRDAYESGFRGLVRRALADLPVEFGLADLQAWVKQHAPHVAIPAGTWSSNLYKMQQAGELDVAKNAQRVSRKLYTRGRVRVGLDGQERSELETAWGEFRAQMERERKDSTEGNGE